ncbi:MAG: hypothetical protein ACOC6F_00030 [bacterium]
MELNPAHAGRFVADLDPKETQLTGCFGSGTSGGGAGKVVNPREMFNDLATVAVVHWAEKDVVEMDTGIEGWVIHRYCREWWTSTVPSADVVGVRREPIRAATSCQNSGSGLDPHRKDV